MSNQMLSETSQNLSSLRDHLRYVPQTGNIYWTQRVGKALPGMKAGCISPKGYRRVQLHGTSYLEHRVAWALYHGEWSKKRITHMNGLLHDNRMANLREMDSINYSQGRWQNIPGDDAYHPGIRLRGKWWYAYIKFHGKTKMLGRFRSKKEAIVVRKDAENRYLHAPRKKEAPHEK